MSGLFMTTRGGGCGAKRSKSAAAENNNNNNNNNNNQDKHLSPVDFILSALRKLMVSTCRQDQEVITAVHQMNIGWPTDVQHVTHVTFDRFHDFLGLPVEFEVDIPCQAPSASVSVCGVSVNPMHSSYDTRCNSVPTILLLMQERLYALGGLEAEGIFRINPENSKEEYVRDQLNKGIVPEKIDVHCLAGLIKAWFRELPSGLLDGLSPERVLQCNTEDEFVELIKQLKPTESCLLRWAIDLMADVAEQEESNKMDARNVALVFAPNMTQMSDPLTALVHAVQVLNLLKTLILKKLRERKDLTNIPKNEKYYNRHETDDTSCESAGQASDNDDDEDRDEVESLSETEYCFLRPLDSGGNENPKDGFRKQLERILCTRDNASPRDVVGSTFCADSCMSTSDDEESRSSSIAFRCKRTRCGRRDQYLLTNMVFY